MDRNFKNSIVLQYVRKINVTEYISNLGIFILQEAKSLYQVRIVMRMFYSEISSIEFYFFRLPNLNFSRYFISVTYALIYDVL